MTPKILVLRVGAQVMLTKNDLNDKSLVNGSRGVVRALKDKLSAMAAVREQLRELQARGEGGGGKREHGRRGMGGAEA